MYIFGTTDGHIWLPGPNSKRTSLAARQLGCDPVSGVICAIFKTIPKHEHISLLMDSHSLRNWANIASKAKNICHIIKKYFQLKLIFENGDCVCHDGLVLHSALLDAMCCSWELKIYYFTR